VSSYTPVDPGKKEVPAHRSYAAIWFPLAIVFTAYMKYCSRNRAKSALRNIVLLLQLFKVYSLVDFINEVIYVSDV